MLYFAGATADFDVPQLFGVLNQEAISADHLGEKRMHAVDW